MRCSIDGIISIYGEVGVISVHDAETSQKL